MQLGRLNASTCWKHSCLMMAWSIQVAAAADVSILVLGDGHGQCGEWQDRDSLDLAGGQLALLVSAAHQTPADAS